MMESRFERIFDKEQKPTDESIKKYIGTEHKEAWLELKQFVEDNYDFTPEIVFYGAKYGWTVRYRKSGKTLCSFFPEKGSFTVLVTLGKKEAEKALDIRDDLSSETRRLLEGSNQLHDGRWLWIRLTEIDKTSDIKKLIQIKRKPNLLR